MVAMFIILLSRRVTYRLIILFVCVQVVNTLLSDSQVGENEEFMDASLVPRETRNLNPIYACDNGW